MDYTLWNNTTDYTSGVTHTNNRTGDPAFANAAAGDYHLSAVSVLAIDQGIDTGVRFDVDGDARPQGPGYDIGADEYTGVLASSVNRLHWFRAVTDRVARNASQTWQKATRLVTGYTN
jgi:hypothetical protein